MLKNRVFLLILMTFFCLSVYGQQKEINFQEFYTAREKSLKKIVDYNHRIKYESEYFQISDGSLKFSDSSIYENLLPDKTRFLKIQKSNDVTKKTEVIKIGYFEYRRTDDGDWTKKDLRNSGNGIGSGMGDGSGNGDVKVTIKYTVSEAELNGQKVMFYDGLVTREYLVGSTTFSSEKFWINKEGLIVKRETKSGYLNPEKIESKTVTEYEYNPKDLKIEAPIK